LHRIPAGAFLFLLAAREDPGKNVVSAIEAFRALREAEGERLRLLIAGQTLPAASLPDGAACAGTVPHADMPGLYSAADAVLCPSAYESFGLVPLEAMAAGRPVIAAAGGFWGDTILSEGGGLAYAPETESGLAEAMRTVFREESLRARLSEEGVRIAARFTWERCTSSWAMLLSSVARPGSPR
jgi:glycosyltransferase involved in cell wall biosynthesis